MCAAAGNVWKLSYAELARLCHTLAHGASIDVSHQVREEASLLDIAWKEALAIDLQQAGAAERQASIALGLRKRTIELVFKTGVTL